MPPESQGPRRQPGGSDLPAPYRSPWAQLGEDLVAVGADLGLRGRELWRRNRQGSLWRPPLWPAALASLFWPLLLAAGAIALVLLALALPHPQLPQGPQPVPVDPGPLPLPVPVGGASDDPPALALADFPGSPPAHPGTMPVDTAHPDPGAGAGPPSSDVAAGEAEPSADGPPTPQDPLDLWLAADQQRPFVVAVEAVPRQSLLVLRLTPEFDDLRDPERLRLAGQWLGDGRDLGYEHLELRDRRGVLRARDARVGSGMILLDVR